jgi:hypothetical protein
MSAARGPLSAYGKTQIGRGFARGCSGAASFCVRFAESAKLYFNAEIFSSGGSGESLTRILDRAASRAIARPAWPLGAS